MTTEQLKTLTPSQLRFCIEKEYYQTLVENRHLTSEPDRTRKLGQLVDDISTVEKVCAHLELYSLAVVCRDIRKELMTFMDITLSPINRTCR